MRLVWSVPTKLNFGIGSHLLYKAVQHIRSGEKKWSRLQTDLSVPLYLYCNFATFGICSACQYILKNEKESQEHHWPSSEITSRPHLRLIRKLKKEHRNWVLCYFWHWSASSGATLLAWIAAQKEHIVKRRRQEKRLTCISLMADPLRLGSKWTALARIHAHRGMYFILCGEEQWEEHLSCHFQTLALINLTNLIHIE